MLKLYHDLSSPRGRTSSADYCPSFCFGNLWYFSGAFHKFSVHQHNDSAFGAWGCFVLRYPRVVPQQSQQHPGKLECQGPVRRCLAFGENFAWENLARAVSLWFWSLVSGWGQGSGPSESLLSSICPQSQLSPPSTLTGSQVSFTDFTFWPPKLLLLGQPLLHPFGSLGVGMPGPVSVQHWGLAGSRGMAGPVGMPLPGGLQGQLFAILCSHLCLKTTTVQLTHRSYGLWVIFYFWISLLCPLQWRELHAHTHTHIHTSSSHLFFPYKNKTISIPLMKQKLFDFTYPGFYFPLYKLCRWNNDGCKVNLSFFFFLSLSRQPLFEIAIGSHLQAWLVLRL